MEMRCVLPYQGRSERSSSSYQTGQDCPPYQMDSLIAAVSGEDRKKYVRFENYNISIFITHNTRNLFHKAHLYKSIRFIHVKKAYTANQNCVQLFHMWKYNQSTIA